MNIDTSKPKVRLSLDKRREKSNGKFPIKLTIYFEGKKERYKTQYEYTKDEWVRINGERLRDDRLKTEKRKLNKLIEHAQEIIDNLSEFTFELFREKYFKTKEKQKEKSVLGLFELFDEYIAALKKEDRIGNASLYQTAKNSLQKFNSHVSYQTLNKETLLQFEKHLRDGQKSPSTIGIYMRHLRAIVNVAIDRGFMPREKYPFSGYTIPASRNIKKALSTEDLRKLLQYEPISEKEKMAYDFWVLSYLCNGMNVADICLLKQHNYLDDLIYFSRSKTIRTRKKDLRPVKVYLHQKAIEIIERYKQKDVSDNDYLFPVLQNSKTAVAIKNKIHDFIRFINEHMKEIGKELKLNKPLHTYTARHCYSTVLKRKKVEIAFIQESLGHSSILTTQNYLDDFEDETRKEYSRILIEI